MNGRTSGHRPRLVRLMRHVLPIVLAGVAAGTAAWAQDAPPDATSTPAPSRVDVSPVARDPEIETRLREIIDATTWFSDATVRVQDGVVFLEGRTSSDESRKWAGDLARNTQDVAAVVNRIEVVKPSVWDFKPAIAGLREIGRDVVVVLPLAALSVVILLATWGVARLAALGVGASLRRRTLTPLLQNVIARGAAALVFVVGLFIVFRIAGLTTMALTVVGGTGILGLVLGIAFRGITENFLASVFLSVQTPFRTGDLVQIAEFVGYVQRLTNRATVLMTLDGNHVQIPNTTVYQSIIRNYSSNPNRREDFTVGIGYEDAIPTAQEIALRVLSEHPAVLADPEPWVLVDSLGKATVDLRIYFWLDGSQHSWLKVRSSVIRLVKRAFQDEGVSMPDEARELIFPDGVPVQIVGADTPLPGVGGARRTASRRSQEPEGASTDAEGKLHTQAGDIEKQARRAREPEEGENLLTR